VLLRKHGGRYVYLQFYMNIIQKLFEKYGGAIPALPKTIRTLFPDTSGRLTGRHFPDVNPPTITCQQKYVIAWERKTGKTQNTGAVTVMFPYVQQHVSESIIPFMSEKMEVYIVYNIYRCALQDCQRWFLEGENSIKFLVYFSYSNSE
jgi:hypothetical protein